MAVKNLKSSKTRTFLTVLGLAVGTGAVMCVISLGTGGKELLDYEMTRLGTNKIWVSAEANTGGSINLEAVAKLAEMSGSQAVSAVKTTYCAVSAGTDSMPIKTIGCQSDYFEISNMQQESGRFINARDSGRRLRSAVLSVQLADKLFGKKNPVGAQISIDGVGFSVIGVVDSLASSFVANPQEALLFIPIETFIKDINRHDPTGSADQVMVSVSEGMDVMAQAQRVVNELARLSGEGVYKANTMSGEIDVANRVMAIFLTIVGSIAVICMLVGGIGIMNMMISSVRERKREIGVMLAIGAAPGDVFAQVLAESAFMSMIGAVFGVGIGAAFTYAGCRYVGMSFAMPFWAIALAIVFSGLIGIFFGAYPAHKASQTSPVEAMRAS